MTDKQLPTPTTGQHIHHDQEKPQTEKGQEVINSLFRSFVAILPKYNPEYKTKQQNVTEKQEWYRAFKDHGICKQAAIDYALAKIRDSGANYLPTIKVFVDHCKDCGRLTEILDEEGSYKEISQWLTIVTRRLDKLSAATYHTYMHLENSYGWKHQMNHKQHKEYWTEEHRITMQLIRDDGKLTVCPREETLIEKVPTHRMTPSEVKKVKDIGQESRRKLMEMIRSNTSKVQGKSKAAHDKTAAAKDKALKDLDAKKNNTT